MVSVLRKGRIDDYLRDSPEHKRESNPNKGYERRLLEEIASLAAEKTAALVTRGLLRELEELRKALETLRRDLAEVKSEIAKLKSTGIRGPKGLRGLDELKEVLERDGFILASEAKSKLGVSPYRLRVLAGELDAVILESEGDYAVLSRRALEEFKALLVNTRTPDAEEAAKFMGRYERLFRVLRDGGRVFYDSRHGWRLL